MILAKNWKLSETPTKDYWFQKIRFVLLMDKLFTINKIRYGDPIAMTIFKKQYSKSLLYWENVKPIQCVFQQIWGSLIYKLLLF